MGYDIITRWACMLAFSRLLRPRVPRSAAPVLAQLSDAASTSAPESPEPTAAASTAPPVAAESVVGVAQSKTFQAETAKLLQIMAKSLYTDKEVFIRELVSNASDALSKLRHLQTQQNEIADGELSSEISISVDSSAKTFTIQDTGIGMTEAELDKNLGTIAHSGTGAFVRDLSESAKNSANLIGQFGVGFYSAFVVASQVTVFTKSAKPGNKGLCWISDGSGSYSISEASNVKRGTKIILKLRDEDTNFADSATVQRIIKQYSNFVGYPIRLNSEIVNTVDALWLKDKASVTQEQHAEFYRFISHMFDSPAFTLHYHTDSPVSIRSLFYVGQTNMERFGMGRTEPGVSVFSRRVLIKPRAKEILPDWLRFISGVVDSEDLPLNVSRENLQDSGLIRRLNDVLTRRIIKWLSEEAKKDSDKYAKFYSDFHGFLKEGAYTDAKNKNEIAKLLRFDSSAAADGKLVSLDDYVERLNKANEGKEEGKKQKAIYYLIGQNRSLCQSSPYLEAFRSKQTEVLFCFDSRDDFVFQSVEKYADFEFQNIEKTLESNSDAEAQTLSAGFLTWFRETVPSLVSEARFSQRLVDSPAIVVNHIPSSVRNLRRIYAHNEVEPIMKYELELNPKHPLVRKLDSLRTSEPDLATTVAAQIVDNALLAAGLLDDSHAMVQRITTLLGRALRDVPESTPQETASPAPAPAEPSAETKA
eukprot:TRINITY_DN6841_c0_g1_i1.p1 TRINITY_DN6841_c0_g1~~TRINITY_DN6841_c0_g1_i1.p1  ORF type:complete len:703 (+),score=207.70 TRINITY_DN6841_c0_g1_i1:2373-4481(+)